MRKDVELPSKRLCISEDVVPMKENKRVARSTAKTGAKNKVRKFHNLHARVQELKGCYLNVDTSFYVFSWGFEFGPNDEKVIIARC